MAYTVNLYNFSKRNNSTKQPTGTGTTYNCDLASGCTIANPRFKINASFSTVSSFNYMKFQNRYYYITDTESLRNDVVIVTGKCDVLATYRTEIGNYNAYVTRSNVGSLIRENLYDNIISPSSEIIKTLDIPVNTKFSLGETTTVFGFNGSGDIRTSADVQNFYYSTSANASSILGRVFCTSNDIFTTIIQNFQQISHNITMVKTFPFKKANTSGSSSTVYVGQWDIGCNDLEHMSVSNFATSTNGRRWGDVITISVPSSIYYGDYRDYDANYVDVSLQVAMVGNISINPQFLRYDKIEIKYGVDLISGMGECTIRAYNSNETPTHYKTIGVYNFVAGYDVPISAYTENIGQIASNIVGLNPTGVILDTISPPVSFTTLSNGSGLANIHLNTCNLQIKVMGTENYTFGNERGKKVMSKNTISNNDGYYECMHPSVAINGLEGESEEVNSYLESGFYYE